MKILFTGGGTGGHFYPIIAIAQALHERVKARKLLAPELHYIAPTKYNPRALFEQGIEFTSVPAGKMRRYFSLQNITDAFKTAYGCIAAIRAVYRIYPDVVFGKGGYASFPTLFAARFLRIPVVIHESDSKPGRVNAWASRFAERVAVSYPESAQNFKLKQGVVAYTGCPIRADIMQPLTNGAHELLGLEQGIPTIVVLGGSQGSQRINDAILEALPELLNRYQIIHQTGKTNLEEIKATAGVILKDHTYSYRYHPFDYLNELALRMAAGSAEVIITRAGSTIFEIASWGVPSIIIPLPTSISHDQTSNAFAYARTGAAVVIEDNNLGSSILVEEIDRIHNSDTVKKTMRERALAFARRDAAPVIADALLDIALKHEK